MALTLNYFYQHTKEKYQLKLLTPELSLDHHITWVHLLEDINNDSFLRGGELIVTTGLECQRPEALFAMTKRCAEHGVSGIIYNTGMYIHTIPDELLSWCNKHHLPAFTMPWDIHISDIMQDYCNEIISEKRIQDIRSAALSHALVHEVPQEYRSVFNQFQGMKLLASDHPLNIPAYATTIFQDVYYYIFNTETSENVFKSISTTEADSICVGVSSTIPLSSTEPYGHSLSTYRKQAYRAMQVSQIKSLHCQSHAPSPISNEIYLSHFQDIGLYNIALSVEDDEVLEEADRELSQIQDTEILETLREYLEHNGSVQDAADALFIHRNTVNYRIQKCRNLLDLDAPHQKLKLLLDFYLCDVRMLRKAFPTHTTTL